MAGLNNLSYLSSVGNLSTYVKNQSLQKKWDHKKETGKVTQAYDPDSYMTDAGKEMARKKNSDIQVMNEWQAQQREAQENGSARLKEIKDKLMYGSDISEEEKEYLKEHDPQTYERIQQEEADQKALEERLKHAKTKDEAQQILTDHTNAAMSTVKSVEGNPYIDDIQKASIYASASRIIRHAQESMYKFIKSGRYEELPTEAEKREAEKEIQEARERELEEMAETIQDESTGQNPEGDAGNISEQLPGEKVTQEDSDKSPVTAAFETKKEQEQSVQEAETSPEALKLKHSKYKITDSDQEQESHTLGLPSLSGAGFDLSV